jgi:hypothetical protein
MVRKCVLRHEEQRKKERQKEALKHPFFLYKESVRNNMQGDLIKLLTKITGIHRYTWIQNR